MCVYCGSATALRLFANIRSSYMRNKDNSGVFYSHETKNA